MGHARLKKLDSGAELWTGDAFEYLYVMDGEKQHDLPTDILYQELESELRTKVIRAAENCESWLTLAAALHLLEASRVASERGEK